MTINRGKVVELFKNQAGLGKIVGKTRAQIHAQWKGSDKLVPAECVGDIVQAGLERGFVLTPQMLRPDLYPVPLTRFSRRKISADK